MCLRTTAGQSQRQLQITLCYHNVFMGCVHAFTSSCAQGKVVMSYQQTQDWLWSILNSFLLHFFGWRVCFWVKFPLGGTSSTNEWVAEFPLTSDGARFCPQSKCCYGTRPQAFKEATETEPERRTLLFLCNWKTKPAYATWKSDFLYPFISAHANESSVDSVLS